MSMSLRRKMALRESAARDAGVARRLAGISRAGQVARTTVPVGGSDLPVVETLEQAVDTAVTLPGVVESADVATGDAYEAAMNVGEAKAVADQSAQDAADALTTASGKNARRRGVTEPAPPEGGWVQGDQWVRDEDRDGVMVPVQVLVWDGTEFVPEQIIADDILVLGADGVVRIADGSVTASSIAATAIDGKVITGATVRTAASGKRLQMDGGAFRAFGASGLETGAIAPTDQGFEILFPGGGGVELYATEGAGAVHATGPGGAAALLSEELFSTVAARFGSQIAGLQQWGSYARLHSSTPLQIDARTTTPGNTFSLKSDLDAWAPIDGTHAWVTSEGREYVRAGGVWKVAFEDTPWANAALGPNVTGTAHWRRYMGVIYVEYNVTVPSVATDGLVNPAFTLPAEARPGVNAPLASVGGGTHLAMGFVSAASGAAVIRNLRNAPQTVFYGGGNWLAPDA